MKTQMRAARKWRMSLLERTDGTQRGYNRRGIFGNGDATRGVLCSILSQLSQFRTVQCSMERKLFSSELLTDGAEIASNAITLKIGGAEWETSCRIFALLSDNCAVHPHLPSLRCFPSRPHSAPPRPFPPCSPRRRLPP